MDRDRPDDQEEEVGLVVQVWLAGLPSSIVRLVAGPWQAATTVAHLIGGTLARKVVPPSDPIDPLRAWTRR